MVHFPAEIWHCILRQATYNPDLLLTTWDYDPDERIWAGWDYQFVDSDPIDSEIATKRVIVQVCRAWRDIGVKFLYEAIRVPRSFRLRELVEVFRSSTSSRVTGVGYGWWTKRIDCPKTVLTSPSITDFLEFLGLCHNLQSLSVIGVVSLSNLTQMRIAEALQTRFSHSFRRLGMYMQIEREDVDSVLALPDVELRTLCIDMCEVLRLSYHRRFEHITTLGLWLSVSNFPSTWTFPFLRNLSLHQLSNSNRDILISFVRRHGRTLVCLCIRTMSLYGADLLPTLISNAPSLRSLAFSDLDLMYLSRWGASLPGLTHLGVIYRGGSPFIGPSHVTGSILRMIHSKILPNLKVIRLLSQAGTDKEDSAWDAASEWCSLHSVKLQDRHGKLISSTLPV